MKKPSIYCHTGFLEFLVSQLPQNIDWSKPVADSDLSLINFYQLVSSRCDLHTQHKNPTELLEQLSNPANVLLNAAFKSNPTSIKPDAQAHKDILALENDFFENCDTSALFLLSETEETCKTIEEAFGVICLPKDKGKIVETAQKLTNVGLKNIVKNGAVKDWNFLNSYRLPCNAIILTDPYLMETPSTGKENLKNILECLLPEKLEKCAFQLNIICSSKSNTPFEQVKGHVNSVIEMIKRPYKIDYGISTAASNKIHNRDLYSNYYCINSDFGFAIFKDATAQQATLVKVLPIGHISGRETPVYDFIKERTAYLKTEIIRITTDSGPAKNHEGLKANRLFNNA